MVPHDSIGRHDYLVHTLMACFVSESLFLINFADDVIEKPFNLPLLVRGLLGDSKLELRAE
jgi:hypothetical protein